MSAATLLIFEIVDGEADMTPGTKELLEQIKTRDNNPMLVADLMRDVAAIAESEREAALRSRFAATHDRNGHPDGVPY